MNFVNTMSLLSRQAKEGEIPLEAALELMRTYLTELRHQTGVSVEKCPIEDRVQAVASLTALSNDINYIFQRNKDKLTEEKDRYAQALERAGGNLEAHSHEMQTVQAQIDHCRHLNAQLQAALEKAAQQNASLEQLRQENLALEQRLKECSPEDPTTEAAMLRQQISEKEQTLAAQAAQVQELTQRQQELTATQQQEQDRLQVLRQQCDQMEQSIAQFQTLIEETAQREAGLQQQLKQKEEGAQQKRQAEAALEKAIAAEQEYTQELLSRLEELEMSLQAKQTDNRIFRESHVEPVQSQLEEATALAASQRQQLQALTAELEQKETERQTVAAESLLLQSQISKKDKQLQQQRSSHEELKATIEDMEARLRDMAAAWTPLLNREKELQQRLDGRNVAQLQQELNAGIARLEQENARADELEKQLGQIKPQINQLHKQVSGLTEELEQATRARQTLHERHDALSGSMEELMSEANRQRVVKLSQQLELMRKILKSMALEGEQFPMEALRPRLDQAERTLSQLRQAIKDYAAMQQAAIEKGI